MHPKISSIEFTYVSAMSTATLTQAPIPVFIRTEEVSTVAKTTTVLDPVTAVKITVIMAVAFSTTIMEVQVDFLEVARDPLPLEQEQVS